MEDRINFLIGDKRYWIPNTDYEDANSALDEAFIIEDASKIKTNADSDSFSKAYWDNIQKAEDKIVKAEESIKIAKEDADKKIEGFNNQIKVLEKRLNTILSSK